MPGKTRLVKYRGQIYSVKRVLRDGSLRARLQGASKSTSLVTIPAGSYQEYSEHAHWDKIISGSRYLKKKR